jgi:hypothetical protein
MTARSGTDMGSPAAYSYAPSTTPQALRYRDYVGWNPIDLKIARPEVIPAHKSTAITIPVFIRSADSGDGLAGATLTISLKKSGGSFSTITPTVTDKGNGWYDLALTTSHTDTLGVAVLHITAPGAVIGQPSGLPNDLIYINVTAVDAYDSAWGLFPTGTVVSDASNSATAFHTSRTESSADYWKNAFLVFTSGALVGQVKLITGFTVSGGVMSFASPGFTATPVAGVSFYIINA